MATRGRAGIIKGAFGRQPAVDMRMRKERMRTVLSSKRRVEIVNCAAAGSGGGSGGGGLGGAVGGESMGERERL